MSQLIKILDTDTGLEKFIPYITGSNYTLPIASTITLGGVKVDGTSIKINNGILSVPATGTIAIPIASSTVLGGVKIGSGITLSADGTISVTSSTGGTSEGQLINLPDQTWYKIIQPTNYGKTYANGTTQGRYFIGGYRDNLGVNFSTEREDKVFTIAAYNILKPNGSREFLSEAGWDETVETHYDNSGFKPYGDFEWHQRMYDSRGFEHRLHSVYVNKTNGRNRQDFEGNTFQYMVASPIAGAVPINYLNVEAINNDGDGTGTFAQLTLLAGKNANSGGKIKWNHNGILSSIEGGGGGVMINTLAGQSSYWDRYGNFFAGYNDGSTVFLGKEYDNRFIDKTKKLQVRGDALIEGGIFQKTASGKIWKLVINETTGAVTAI